MRRSMPSGSPGRYWRFFLVQGAAHAATCTAEDFAAAVDKSGAALRAFNAEALPKLQDKLKQLKDKQGLGRGERRSAPCATSAPPSSTPTPRI